MAKKDVFGKTSDGQNVDRVRLTGGGLKANIITWGASVQSLYLEGHAPSLVLGFNEFQTYIDHGLYFGASVGRFSNRIANGQFAIDDTTYQTDQNYISKHTLHGGSKGCATQNWEIADIGTSHVDLTLTLKDGHMGFPGTVNIVCSYVLKDDGTLSVTYVTRSDAPTVAGMTHHSYFSLDDTLDVRDTLFKVHAENYLPVDDDLIPTGEIAPVCGTAFDFSAPKSIREHTSTGTVYDHNLCLNKERRNIQRVATARSPHSGIVLDVSTTEPGLQFFGANAMDIPVAGLDGQKYGPFSGFCMEPQIWPDAPNHPDFPNAILRPNEELRQSSTFQFTKA